MKLIDIKELNPPYDLPKGLGEALIASGLAKKYEPFTPAALPNTTWKACEGYRGRDYVEAPRIVFSCSSCGNRGQMEGPNCEKTQSFVHCDTTEFVPAEVKKEFRRLRDAWDRSHRRATANINGNR